MQNANYKVHLNKLSFGKLSDPLFDSVKRGLTLVRLGFWHIQSFSSRVRYRVLFKEVKRVNVFVLYGNINMYFWFFSYKDDLKVQRQFFFMVFQYIKHNTTVRKCVSTYYELMKMFIKHIDCDVAWKWSPNRIIEFNNRCLCTIGFKASKLMTDFITGQKSERTIYCIMMR